jgi:hypothetical protein
MTMTYWHMTPTWKVTGYVTCITIIDTIILPNYTNDAYTYLTKRKISARPREPHKTRPSSSEMIGKVTLWWV